MPMVRFRLKGKFNDVLLHLGSRRLLRFVSPYPEGVNINVTENCNSRCVTCYAWKNRSVGELTTEEIKDALRQLRDIGVTTAIFVGGEPLIRRDIMDLLKESRRLKFETRMVVTNGLLLEDKAKELLESGITHISVSVDGIGNSNEIIRGVSGNFEKSLRGIRAIQEIKKDMGSDVTVTLITTILLNQNVDEIAQLIEVSRKLGVYWDFNLLDPNLPIFEGIPFSKLLVKSEEKIDKTIDYLKKVRTESPELISSCDHILEYARNYLKGKKQNNIHCVHGYKLIYLGAHGEVHPGCWAMEPAGNLRENKLSDIIKSQKYRRLAEKIYMNDCLGCTNLYGINVIVHYLFSHWLRCEK